jgi:DNA-binding transcriptional MerR regulator
LSPEATAKVYYSIGEVSELTGVKPYVLRFWEREFPLLKPKKNSAGNRSYQQKDIELVNQIKHLLYEGHTIPGANQKLRTLKGNKEIQLEMELSQLKNLLFEVKAELTELLKYLQ